jgi:hypothetical protein
MNIEPTEFAHKQSLTLSERIDKLRKRINLENSQEKTFWLQARLTEVADTIKEEVVSTLPGLQLVGIPEWEKLVGGSEEVGFDVTARKYVQELLSIKLTEIEEQLGKQ